ncbi:Similar to Mkp3: Dual specificity protein phosphatase Mpk3 (Drosophila melanogaster) [Cotesia congregata]|uniref:Similar to Mkp3: Dual specificity protein phosphatase Mpk3 (Drosophila melanogaster) n=1 Tax=Cotesia congregata TaxID=51543 RepID=A0A8J2HJK4_COTCN|nr:Similar to Mkp3: Dual specificity protein phosphatase Mpk3 (Drosophila melanogaster) [Cotesia congregata]
MPGEGMVEEEGYVGHEWFFRELRSQGGPDRLLILDCRAHSDFLEAHIRNSVPLAIPSIMLRRLAAGKVDLLATIRCLELRNRVEVFLYGDDDRRGTFVLIGDSTDPAGHQGETIQVLSRRLKSSGGYVVTLIGGFGAFRDRYPEWCEGSQANAEGQPGQENNVGELMGLRTLRISTPPTRAYSDSDSDSTCDSVVGPEEDKDFPVEILPHLYLGNAANSEDHDSLSRHRIQYILNVTADLPNVFEDAGSIKYMQIPINDHHSQNLASFFPQAIQFIEEARSSDKGVLVHCLAGVSRSVTITIAYLMHKCNLSLNDAFNLVRSRKTNVAPNFSFLEQLYRFESELRDRGDRKRNNRCIGACQPGGPCNCPAPSFLSPVDLGPSPDSGIEFDKWAASTPAE